MKKQITSLLALVISFVIGASALTALAQVSTWNPAPQSGAPNDNVSAPINVGMSDQTKLGILRLVDLVVAKLNVNNDVPVAGDVLTAKDASGTLEWRSPAVASGSCRLLISTGGFGRPNSPLASGWSTVPVPNECLNGTCSLFMPIYSNATLEGGGGEVTSLKTTVITQFSSGTDVTNQWAKPGSNNDGTSCVTGKNGTTSGCDSIILSGTGIGIYDDDYSSGGTFSGDKSATLWTIRDTDTNNRALVYVCN